MDDASEEWEKIKEEQEVLKKVEEAKAAESSNTVNGMNHGSDSSEDVDMIDRVDASDATMRILEMPPGLNSIHDSIRSSSSQFLSTTSPMPIVRGGAGGLSSRRDRQTPSPEAGLITTGPEGPITPRNDAGPWVFDGGVGPQCAVPVSTASGGMPSIDSATTASNRRP